MAVIIPILIASTATGAAAAAAIGLSAGMLATLTTVAFAVTGINEKINKAAGNVFGEDLVKVVNLAGMAYGAYNGGFDIGGGGAAASAADYVNGADLASDMAVATNGAGNVVENLAGSAGYVNQMDAASDL